MKSTWLTHQSAFILLIAGLAMLFLPDVILPAIHSGYPATAGWVGQMAAAGWLAVAALNWLQRRAVIGGIYHRPLVIANLLVYFVSGASLIPVVARGRGSIWVVTILVVALMMAAAYAYLLRRGPLRTDKAH